MQYSYLNVSLFHMTSEDLEYSVRLTWATLKKKSSKNTSRSKEDTDNTLTDKTGQVTFGIKQCLSFKIVFFFFEIQTINTI